MAYSSRTINIHCPANVVTWSSLSSMHCDTKALLLRHSHGIPVRIMQCTVLEMHLASCDVYSNHTLVPELLRKYHRLGRPCRLCCNAAQDLVNHHPKLGLALPQACAHGLDCICCFRGICNLSILPLREELKGRVPHFRVDDVVFLPLAAELESQFFEQLEPATDNGQEGVEAVEYGKQADDVAPNGDQRGELCQVPMTFTHRLLHFQHLAIPWSPHFLREFL
mmetsp:Transcript_83025/g.199248  ORF Transcript_83025/g.199248 Transcript_83025/m.199248 type:complete len:223 (-) Transcript_83025:217-885(-)